MNATQITLRVIAWLVASAVAAAVLDLLRRGLRELLRRSGK